MTTNDVYLRAMGIERWLLRPVAPVKNRDRSEVLLELLSEKGDCRGYLLLASPSLQLKEEARALLTAMLAAIELSAQLTSHFSMEMVESKPGKPIFVMGEKMAQFFLRRQSPLHDLRGQSHYRQGYPQFAVVPSFSLEELLTNPALKRGAWADLCLFKKQIQ